MSYDDVMLLHASQHKILALHMSPDNCVKKDCVESGNIWIIMLGYGVCFSQHTHFFGHH